MESEKHLTFKATFPKTSLIEEEIKETSECQREHREKQHFEKQIRQRENYFQEELKKLMEAEQVSLSQLLMEYVSPGEICLWVTLSINVFSYDPAVIGNENIHQ